MGSFRPNQKRTYVTCRDLTYREFAVSYAPWLITDRSVMRGGGSQMDNYHPCRRIYKSWWFVVLALTIASANPQHCSSLMQQMYVHSFYLKLPFSWNGPGIFGLEFVGEKLWYPKALIFSFEPADFVFSFYGSCNFRKLLVFDVRVTYSKFSYFRK